MAIKDLLNKFNGRKEEEFDDGTLDKSLHSLRKAKQVIDEREEKLALKEFIKQDRMEEMRSHLFGIKKENIGKKVHLMKDIDMREKRPLLKEKGLLDNKSMLNNKIDEFRKTKPINVLNNDINILGSKKAKKIQTLK